MNKRRTPPDRPPRQARVVRRSAGEQNSVRIIGGRWRGKRIHFPDGEGLRPTPSRLRETLFNWLMHDIRDARVLDLFAGSGALAFEALSRGAREAVLVDSSRTTCARLSQELASLSGANGRVVCARAEDFLQQPAGAPFDIVFLDPPFHQGLLGIVMPLLETGGVLKLDSLIYVESESEPDIVPANRQRHRCVTVGQVYCGLYRRSSEN